MDKIAAKNAIRALALGDQIVFTLHAKRRDPARGKFPLSREQVKNCLIHGVVTEGPAPDIKEPSGWKMRITRLRDEERHEVACVLIPENDVLVITAYGYRRRQR